MTRKEIISSHAGRLHEYFESVRSDVLAVPDSDVTENIISEAISESEKAGDFRVESDARALAVELMHAKSDLAACLKREGNPISQVIDHGYFVFLSGSGPLACLPISWFAYDQDAKDWAASHGSEDYPCVIKPKRRA